MHLLVEAQTRDEQHAQWIDHIWCSKIRNVELNKKSLYFRVPGCQISMYYYVGFAYMMMRRYADAIRTFSNILLYIQRTRGLFQVRNFPVFI